MDEVGLLLGALGLAVGGILKGATGAGAPLLAVPILAVLYDVPFAVAVLTFPSLFSNAWQSWRFRAFQEDKVFVWVFALAAAAGAGLGSVLLVALPANLLLATMGGALLLYIAFRLARPTWVLGERVAKRLVAPAGFVGGVMQGAAGLSAPISLTFLTAMRLDRRRFIATISVFFAMMSVVQIPALVAVGVMTWERMGLSLLACVPMFGAMPVGAWLGRRISRETFDRLMLVILALIAVRLLAEAVIA
ncbi:MAG: sulfite exporter TauE/SafE family protein [Pseudomonadota bacterium]